MYCSACGKPNRDGARFCWTCGEDLSLNGPPAASIGGAGTTLLEREPGAGAVSIGVSGRTLAEEPPATGVAFAAGTLIDGHYRLEHALGQGGMGRVWLARDIKLDQRPVALKFISPALWQSGAARQRFLTEAKVCLDLTHTGIVRVHHLGEWAGQDYLAMEYLDGPTLGQWHAELRARGGGPDWGTLCETLAQVLEAVGYAHQMGVIHRDLKPANIMLARRGGGGRRQEGPTRAVVMDFGLARAEAGEVLTRTGLALGTPYYMSPEQMAGAKTVDQRTDIFALGVITYELLTGKLPLGRVAPPSTLAAGLPPGIDEFVFKCLEHEPGERFASAGAMAGALKKLALGKMAAEIRALQAGKKKTAAAPKTAGTTPTAPTKKASGDVGAAKPATPTALEIARKSGPSEGRSTSVLAPAMILGQRTEEIPYAEDIGGGVRMEMLWIPGGAFLMGNKDGTPDEQPLHLVGLKGFWMGKLPVTQEQYEKVMGKNPSQFPGRHNPVEGVTWNDAWEFCKKLTKQTGKPYTLPSEAQWEYACRAGGHGKWCFGDEAALLREYAWYKENSGRTWFNVGCATHPVGEKRPNAWGLCDMHGNVFEWCADWYHGNYTGAPADGSPWVTLPATMRVLRGGSWDGDAGQCQAGTRSPYSPEKVNRSVGLRVVRNPL